MKVKSNLDEILYDRMIESLISGDYTMGQNLTLDELAKRFEVSRTPVVQAVKLLVNDGVLQTMSNGRLYVPEYDRTTVKQMCEVRHLIEGYALGAFLAGEGLTGDDVVPRLERYAELCRTLAEDGQYVAFATADRKFHRTLVEASGNGVLVETYARVQGRFLVASYLIRPLHSRDFSGTIAGHDQILEAIRAGDTQRAQDYLRSHIEGVLRALGK